MNVELMKRYLMELEKNGSFYLKWRLQSNNLDINNQIMHTIINSINKTH